MKRSFILFMFTLICAIIVAQTPVAPVGTGTSGDPYLIASMGNLEWWRINAASSSYAKMTANIDASETATSGWGGKTALAGSFDGNGYVISNLNIVGNKSFVTNNNGAALVKNTGFDNLAASGIAGDWSCIMGQGYSGGNITDCFVKGTISANANYANGGFCVFSVKS